MKSSRAIDKQLLTLIAKTKKLAINTLKEDTQELRKVLIADLQEMFHIAKKNAVSAENSTDSQQWMRIAGYIGQVINSHVKCFDETKALKQIENIEKMINEAEHQPGSET